MNHRLYKQSKKYLTLMIVAVFLSSCATTTSIQHGALADGVYQSSTDEFSVTVPVNAVVHDGKHPLGGYVAIKALPEPIKERGIAYYRVAQSSSNSLTLKEKKGIVKSSHDDWLKNYVLRDSDDVVHEEWIETDKTLAYFTVIEGAKSGFLVKPGAYYGVISLVEGNYSYVVYEIMATPYELVGKADSAETASIKSKTTRFDGIQQYLDSITFLDGKSVKFPMK